MSRIAFLFFSAQELMIRSSISFVNVLLPHLLSKLAMIVFYEVGEVVKVGLVDVSLFSWEE